VGDTNTIKQLYLLHSLIEWQLQDSQAIKTIIDINNANTTRNQLNPIKSYPLGVDSKKRTYWQFGGIFFFFMITSDF
jgi:hypothetical protein